MFWCYNAIGRIFPYSVFRFLTTGEYYLLMAKKYHYFLSVFTRIFGIGTLDSTQKSINKNLSVYLILGNKHWAGWHECHCKVLCKKQTFLDVEKKRRRKNDNEKKRRRKNVCMRNMYSCLHGWSMWIKIRFHPKARDLFGSIVPRTLIIPNCFVSSPSVHENRC